jgi:starch-binding outer membrane protein SusE/F
MLTGGTWAGGEFEKRDADPGFPGPPTAGRYKITVDFQLGVFTSEKK